MAFITEPERRIPIVHETDVRHRPCVIQFGGILVEIQGLAMVLLNPSAMMMYVSHPELRFSSRLPESLRIPVQCPLRVPDTRAVTKLVAVRQFDHRWSVTLLCPIPEEIKRPFNIRVDSVAAPEQDQAQTVIRWSMPLLDCLAVEFRCLGIVIGHGRIIVE